jgi:hypothetical protein
MDANGAFLENAHGGSFFFGFFCDLLCQQARTCRGNRRRRHTPVASMARLLGVHSLVPLDAAKC